MKLKSPKGVILTPEETATVIEVWKQDQKTLLTNNDKLERAERDMRSTLEYKLPDALRDTLEARREASRYFKITKDPIKKREWARRLVVADRAYNAVKGAQQRMEAMGDRVKSIVADASLEKKALDIRIAEAEAYQKMGQGLRLVGETLVAARLRAKTAEVEFSNIELGLEGLEGIVKGTTDTKIIEQAKEIMGREDD